jgi:hypothetical protein
MSSATATATAPRQLIEEMEQAYCINEVCGAVIPREFVFKNVKRGSATEPTRRVVKAFCQHCDRVYRVTQVLRDGRYRDEGNVEVMSSTERAGVLARVAHLRGDVQRAVDA